MSTLWYGGIIAALGIMFLGESVKNETKSEYIEKGYNWKIVLLSSTLAGIFGGLLSIVTLTINNVDSTWNPYFLPFAATIASYVTVQSFMTDLRILKINRQILRFGYVPMFIISIYNISISPTMKLNLSAFIVFTVLLILIFLFSSIGASDVRAMAVLLPYVVSLGGFIAIIFFSIVLLIVALGMGIRNLIRDKKAFSEFKRKHPESYESMNKLVFYKFARDFIREEKTIEELATPVGPYMITPFLIYILIFPFITS